MVYNLAFGDVSESGDASDTVVTNNGDSKKVLITVGQIVLLFLERNPKCFVFATGNTIARTRLYRIGIANNLAEIETDFYIYGW